MKIYTGGGDAGMTGLQGGLRVSKSDGVISAYGALDEANALLGLAAAGDLPDEVREALGEIQEGLFVVGADLSNPDLGKSANRVTASMVASLERRIDGIDGRLPPLANFILPGGNGAGATLHVARAVVRRAEAHMAAVLDRINPLCLVYANRLSDLLFVLARLANADEPERVWKG